MQDIAINTENVTTVGKEAWDTPKMEALLVEQTAIHPGVQHDGGVQADCTLS